MGLRLNIKRIKVMMIGTVTDFRTDNEESEMAGNICFLGLTINSKGTLVKKYVCH